MWTRVSITLLVLISIKLHSYIILFDRGIWCSSCLSYFLLLKVDRHPQFRHSRCFFVIRTDGGWIDFSYQKCLRAYIRTNTHRLQSGLFASISNVVVDEFMLPLTLSYGLTEFVLIERDVWMIRVCLACTCIYKFIEFSKYGTQPEFWFFKTVFEFCDCLYFENIFYVLFVFIKNIVDND